MLAAAIAIREVFPVRCFFGAREEEQEES